MLGNGSHRYHRQSAQRTGCRVLRSSEGERKKREVEAHGQLKSKDRGQGALTMAYRGSPDPLIFLQFSSLFRPKVPGVDLLGSLWIFYQRKARRVYSQKQSNQIGFSGVFCDIIPLRAVHTWIRRTRRIRIQRQLRVCFECTCWLTGFDLLQLCSRFRGSKKNGWLHLIFRGACVHKLGSLQGRSHHLSSRQRS